MAFQLTVLMMIMLVIPAYAVFSREDYYAMGIAALEEMTVEQVQQAIDAFEKAGNAGEAKNYKQYAQSLLEIFLLDEGGEPDLELTIYRFSMLEGKQSFVESLSENYLPSCGGLIMYIEARQLETAGEYAEAWHCYAETEEVLDSIDRQISLTKKAYEQGKAAYDNGDYKQAADALKGLNWKDSGELYEKAMSIIAPTPAPTPKPMQTPVPKPALTPRPTARPTPAPTQAPAPEIGETVIFGRYPQTVGGRDSTAIEWIVLDTSGDKVLLISRYGLDAKQYNNSNKSITWENCTLRTWLNSTFLDKAFTREEQASVQTTWIDNSRRQNSPESSADGGNDTYDRVFLLSCAEAEKYFSCDEDRICAPTDYAENHGAGTSDKYKGVEMACWWWLRSPGLYQYNTAYINYFGACHYYVGSLTSGCVRPALWVDAEAISW